MSNSIVAGSLISNDATWRERVSFMSALLDAAGQARTADAGQITVASATQPGANNTAAGYEIRAFGDAGSAIVYKLEYGRGAAANTFATWWTIGTGSDGSGNITGTLFARTQFDGSSGAADPAANLYGSAGNNWAHFIFMTATATTPRWFMHISRSFDDLGVPDNVGIQIFQQASGATKTFVFRTGAVSTSEVTPHQLCPPNTIATDSLPDGNRAVIPVSWWDRTKLMPPSPNWAFGKDTGFVSLTEYSPVVVAGQTGNFKAFTFLTSYNLGMRSSALWNTHLVRWE